MSNPLDIVLVEPFFGGSHKKWAQGFQKHSHHNIQLLTLSAHHWKWRMRVGSIELAKQYNQLNIEPDVILATDMLDLAQFIGFIKFRKRPKVVLYMHENQITYPWSPTDTDLPNKRDHHYGFINYTSCLAADEIWFNSEYHRTSFFGELPNFLGLFPDFNQMDSIHVLEKKSNVIPVGNELTSNHNVKNKPHRVLWNHRWEYDKNPEQFFKVLETIQAQNIEFELVVLGEKGNKYPAVFDKAQQQFINELVHFGYAESDTAYRKLMDSCGVLPVTSNQDFFGISVVEAINAGVVPLLPNRLAYPEHIPTELHQDYLYNNEAGLTEKLVRMLSGNTPINHQQKLQQHCKKYDWESISSEMDNALSRLK